jgi:acetyl-CoA carboxylase biotin carboxylase subunit
VFKKVLVANRGEIALRIIRACKELGLRTVAVHSTVDAEALHVRFADESVCIGPAAPTRSYLHLPSLIAAAEITGADAIHPGYGFLSENAEFAEVCRRCRITFIGPSPEAMRAWGDKVSARANAARFGFPMLPGTEVLRDPEHAREEARRIGYPVILKASGGGGGRGMKIVRAEADLENAFRTAQSEALAGFKNPECTLQRRHQKVIEEAPSPNLRPQLREHLMEVVANAVRETGYTSLGTLEFLLDERGEAYFMEMNTRVQVEHPITEAVTGLDLVAEQILIAAGAKLRVQSHKITPRGHAIECRINAEDPVTFAPSPGRVTTYLAPGGLGVRVDSGIYAGWNVPPHYDSLLAKLIVHSTDRAGAIARMRRALDEFVVEGIKTNIPLHRRILEHPKFQRGEVTTRFLEQMLAEG